MPKTVNCPMCKQDRAMSCSNFNKIKSLNCRKCEDIKRTNDSINRLIQKNKAIIIVKIHKPTKQGTRLTTICKTCKSEYTSLLSNLIKSKEWTCSHCAKVKNGKTILCRFTSGH